MLAFLAVVQVAGAVLTNVGHLRSCEWEKPSRTVRESLEQAFPTDRFPGEALDNKNMVHEV